MASPKLSLRIITPQAETSGETADMIIMHCTTGYMGILPGHAPLSAVLGYGSLHVYNGDEVHQIPIHGGLALVKNDVMTIITTGE